MFKDLTKAVLTAKAALDVIKEKLESKVCNLAIQLKNFKEKGADFSTTSTETQDGQECDLKEKAKEDLFNLISEITHRAQINEVQLRGFVREKLTELTNNALLDSMELNDIRAEIANLRAEIAELKDQLQFQKK